MPFQRCAFDTAGWESILYRRYNVSALRLPGAADDSNVPVVPVVKVLCRDHHLCKGKLKELATSAGISV